MKFHSYIFNGPYFNLNKKNCKTVTSLLMELPCLWMYHVRSLTLYLLGFFLWFHVFVANVFWNCHSKQWDHNLLVVSWTACVSRNLPLKGCCAANSYLVNYKLFYTSWNNHNAHINKSLWQHELTQQRMSAYSLLRTHAKLVKY